MRRLPTTVVLLSALAVVAAACGGGKKGTGFPSPGATPTATVTATATGSPPESPKPGQETVMSVDNAFEPRDVTVKVGTKIVWEQTGTQPHTVTADDKSFDSHPDCNTFADSTAGKCMEAGDTYAFTAEKVGEIPYFCKIHGAVGGQGMAGKIIVEA